MNTYVYRESFFLFTLLFENIIINVNRSIIMLGSV